jgi:hypothetical protein
LRWADEDDSMIWQGEEDVFEKIVREGEAGIGGAEDEDSVLIVTGRWHV